MPSRGSYHGGSPQTIGLTSNAAYKYPVASGFDSTNVGTARRQQKKTKKNFVVSENWKISHSVHKDAYKQVKLNKLKKKTAIKHWH